MIEGVGMQQGPRCKDKEREEVSHGAMRLDKASLHQTEKKKVILKK